MSRYDFALGPERKTKSRWSEDSNSRNLNSNYLEGFVPAKNKLQPRKAFPPPELPKDFAPVHAVRKSRFYPPIENVPRTIENRKRKDLTAADRARILEDSNSIKKVSDSHPNAVPSVASNIISKTLNLHGRQQTEERRKLESQQVKAATSWMDKLNAQSFVKGGSVGSIKDSEGNLKKLEEFKDSSTSDECQIFASTSKSEEVSSTKKTTAKPFMSNPDKQRRFEQYVVLLKNDEKHKLESIQPLSMTEWDREQERIEFEQAARLFEQSTDDCVTSKFTHASDTADSGTAPAKYSQEDEMKQAVKMKMFGKLTRERIEWKPASIVCKRFNIPEPKVGCAQSEMQRKPAKFSIFDSINWNSSTKFLRATDTVSNEVVKANVESKDTDAASSAHSEVESHNDIFFVDRRAQESVTEKMRNFEASYEKVFGKEVQGSSKVSEAKNNLDSEIGSSRVSEVADEVEINQGSTDTLKTAAKSTSEEKKDLFKAIFLSSSEESDSEPEESVDSEIVKSVLIGKAPSEMNTSRNTSPPRGIFAMVDLDNLMTSSSTAQANENVNKEKDAAVTIKIEPDDETNRDDGGSNPVDSSLLPNMYGPALPSRLTKPENPTSEVSSSEVPKPVFRSVVVSKSKVDSGVWVERGKVKKSKKEKKKHKHKEHKSSKHKRKSKKEKRDS